MEITEANEEDYNHKFWSRVWIKGNYRAYTKKDGNVTMTSPDDYFQVKVEHSGMVITCYKGGKLLFTPYNVAMIGDVKREGHKNWKVTKGLDINMVWPAFITK